jgi:hypothetical protein
VFPLVVAVNALSYGASQTRITRDSCTSLRFPNVAPGRNQPSQNLHRLSPALRPPPLWLNRVRRDLKKRDRNLASVNAWLVMNGYTHGSWGRMWRSQRCPRENVAPPPSESRHVHGRSMSLRHQACSNHCWTRWHGCAWTHTGGSEDAPTDAEASGMTQPSIAANKALHVLHALRGLAFKSRPVPPVGYLDAMVPSF